MKHTLNCQYCNKEITGRTFVRPATCFTCREKRGKERHLTRKKLLGISREQWANEHAILKGAVRQSDGLIGGA